MNTVPAELLGFDIDTVQPIADRKVAFTKATFIELHDLADADFADEVTGRYEAQLIELPKGVTEDEVRKHIADLDLEQPWQLAAPQHMLAFGVLHGKELVQKLKFIVGLGGNKKTVIAAIFRGMGMGMQFLFVPMDDNWSIHAGGQKVRFLAVRARP